MERCRAQDAESGTRSTQLTQLGPSTNKHTSKALELSREDFCVGCVREQLVRPCAEEAATVCPTTYVQRSLLSESTRLALGILFTARELEQRESADSIGSHILGRRRGAAIEAAVVRHFRHLIGGGVVIMTLLIAGGEMIQISPTLRTVSRCLGGAYLITSGLLVWLTVRVSPVHMLVRRPAAWVFLVAVLVHVVIDIWRDAGTADFATAVILSLVWLIDLGLLPMVDALPPALVRPFGWWRR